MTAVARSAALSCLECAGFRGGLSERMEFLQVYVPDVGGRSRKFRVIGTQEQHMAAPLRFQSGRRSADRPPHLQGVSHMISAARSHMRRRSLTGLISGQTDHCEPRALLSAVPLNTDGDVVRSEAAPVDADANIPGGEPCSAFPASEPREEVRDELSGAVGLVPETAAKAGVEPVTRPGTEFSPAPEPGQIPGDETWPWITGDVHEPGPGLAEDVSERVPLADVSPDGGAWPPDMWPPDMWPTDVAVQSESEQLPGDAHWPVEWLGPIDGPPPVESLLPVNEPLPAEEPVPGDNWRPEWVWRSQATEGAEAELPEPEIMLADDGQVTLEREAEREVVPEEVLPSETEDMFLTELALLALHMTSLQDPLDQTAAAAAEDLMFLPSAATRESLFSSPPLSSPSADAGPSSSVSAEVGAEADPGETAPFAVRSLPVGRGRMASFGRRVDSAAVPAALPSSAVVDWNALAPLLTVPDHSQNADAAETEQSVVRRTQEAAGSAAAASAAAVPETGTAAAAGNAPDQSASVSRGRRSLSLPAPAATIDRLMTEFAEDGFHA